jgi:protein-arginine kinase activator protein McsA
VPLIHAAKGCGIIKSDDPDLTQRLNQEAAVALAAGRAAGLQISEAEAIRMATEYKPGLILADVNLGRGGDGITAVRQILRHVSIPVIFVTAYAERLLTAEGVEPAFIISKPFDRMTLAIAIYQAITAGQIPAVQVSARREPIAAARCPGCGLPFADFRQTGLLGCPACYDAFMPQIGAVIERAQAGAVHHVGRSPQRLEGMADRVALRKRLMQELETAIAAEQYERAARLRDQLQGLGDVGGKA